MRVQVVTTGVDGSTPVGVVEIHIVLTSSLGVVCSVSKVRVVTLTSVVA